MDSYRLVDASEVTAEVRLEYVLRNRAHLAEYAPQRPESHFTLSGQEIRLAGEVKSMAEGRSFGRYLMHEDTCEGFMFISEIVKGFFQSAYFSYEVSKRVEGQGVAFWACTEFLQLAQEQVGISRFEANIQPSNERSIRLAERLGFEKEGYSPKYLNINGEWHDHVRYALVLR